jgi:hypothetical protein
MRVAVAGESVAVASRCCWRVSRCCWSLLLLLESIAVARQRRWSPSLLSLESQLLSLESVAVASCC